jgi:hypothetical protein
MLLCVILLNRGDVEVKSTLKIIVITITCVCFVLTVSGLRARRSGVRIPAEARDFFYLLQKLPDWLWCPRNLLFRGYLASIL